jgi:hypothetical protein
MHHPVSDPRFGVAGGKFRSPGFTVGKTHARAPGR